MLTNLQDRTTSRRMLSDEKVLHALGYIARKCKNDPGLTKLVALKLLYLADRWHLRQYGRTVTRDKYYAMQYGPVPINARKLIENKFESVPGAEKYLTITKPHRYELIESKAEPDLDWLSVSDRQALDAAIKVYEKYGAGKIVDFTHSFPEWKNKKAKLDAALLKNRRSVKMDMDDFFLPCEENGKEYCDASNERLRASKEYFHIYE